jgi:hypothetical protein
VFIFCVLHIVTRRVAVCCAMFVPALYFEAAVSAAWLRLYTLVASGSI